MNATLFTHGRIVTLDPIAPSVEALAVQDGRIVAVGRTNELLEAFGGFRRIDLGGRPVVPGFVDCHIHLASYGISLHRIDLQPARSLRDAVTLVAAAVGRARPGVWIRGRGWDKNRWPEQQFPTKEDLDPISVEHPIALSSKDGHLLWVNSAALRVAGIDPQTPDPAGGEIARNARGEPTGILKEEATRLVWNAVPPADAHTVEQGILDAAVAIHRLGIVGVHSFVGTDASEGSVAFSAFQRLQAQAGLKLRVWITLPASALDDAAGVGLHTGFGNEWLRVGPVKVFADGTLGSQTASMLEPFDGQPRNAGIAVHTADELADLVARAVSGGFWCAVHAIGDRANRAVLDAYETHWNASQRLGARHRIEHVQLLHPDDFPRLARLQVIASMQPIHATSDRDIAERYWGRRSRYAYAWRSLRDCGTVLAFGSDAPVETPDVFQGLYAAVTRRRGDEPDGEPWYPEEALTIDEAIRGYTVGAAYASGEEDHRGTLTVGKLADFAVLNHDVLQAGPEGLLQARVVATVIGGAIVYRGPEFSD
jgi:predicted amidohydrolase YtcJ